MLSESDVFDRFLAPILMILDWILVGRMVQLYIYAYRGNTLDPIALRKAEHLLSISLFAHALCSFCLP